MDCYTDVGRKTAGCSNLSSRSAAGSRTEGGPRAVHGPTGLAHQLIHHVLSAGLSRAAHGSSAVGSSLFALSLCLGLPHAELLYSALRRRRSCLG